MNLQIFVPPKSDPDQTTVSAEVGGVPEEIVERAVYRSFYLDAAHVNGKMLVLVVAAECPTGPRDLTDEEMATSFTQVAELFHGLMMRKVLNALDTPGDVSDDSPDSPTYPEA